MPLQSDAERRVWELLTRDFRWRLPDDFDVKLLGESPRDGLARLQVFEVAVAKVFAALRPDYHWFVTQDRPDGGLDFIGQCEFISDEALGIAAAITVGGQCKKRTRVDDIVGEVAGSLARMADSVDPTFFVVALSARLERSRVEAARSILERTHQRHCHILDREQIEGLFHENLAAVDEVLRAGLQGDERREVLDYFHTGHERPPAVSAEVVAPERVLAGIPFSVAVTLKAPFVSSRARLRWMRGGRSIGAVTLVGPIGADEPLGVELIGTADDPMDIQRSLELLTYSVGELDLGAVVFSRELDGAPEALARVELGTVQVIENVRPRFFEPPFRAALARLDQQYERALAAGVASIGVVGAGGSGKSRVCEEFALERRRRGCAVVTAKQAKTLDDPHRVLAELLAGLVDGGITVGDPAEQVVEGVASYDPALAARAEPAIRSVFGDGGDPSGEASEQELLSSLVVLIAALGRRGPLIIHLQDLHWCAADVLIVLERLVWQLEKVLVGRGAAGAASAGVLFVLEGRARERGAGSDASWTSEPLEAFLQRLDCLVAACSMFSPEDGLTFIRRLFEDRHSARRRVNADLLGLQHDLVEHVNHTAGGNPFHSLEQVQLLKESGVVGQNPHTGLLYLVRPISSQPLLPDSVFESIQLRWRYLRKRTPELALLLWAAALLEDRIPTPLFRRLWRELAPEASLHDIDATELLWTGEGEEREIAFRHENYFRSIRRFEVSADDRERVVRIYADWFSGDPRRDPADKFRWARVLLELPRPDVASARTILRSAAQAARRRGDLRLARRISTTLLDLVWDEDDRSPVRTATFLGACRDDLALARDLLGSDRAQAGRRLEALGERIARRLASGRRLAPRNVDELRRAELTTEVLRCQYLFNDQRSAIASDVAARSVRGIQAMRPSRVDDPGAWDALEMEALHSHAVALALSGELDPALEESALAVAIARRSPTAISPHIVSTYAAILLATDPVAAERVLRDCIAGLADGPESGPLRDEAEINLGEALILRAHRAEDADEAAAMLDEAKGRLMRVFTGCFQLGQYPDAAAAALLLGVISAMLRKGEETYWFAQAVAAASRGRHMETLWRAQINLATATRLASADATAGQDHARAALEIVEETLAPYPDPDGSPRFRVVSHALAQAVRLPVLAGDDAGSASLARHPTLRARVEDMDGSTAGGAEPEGGHYQWLRVADAHYMLY